MKIGSFFPNQSSPVFFALSADDLELHFLREKLTPKQLVDDAENKNLMCTLQVASLYMGKPEDNTSFYEEFKKNSWNKVLFRYHNFFTNMGINPISLENVFYYSMDSYYDTVEQDRGDIELVAIHLVSGSNLMLHQDSQSLSMSQTVNSKMYLARTASENDILVPETMVCKKGDLNNPEVKEFLKNYGPEVMLKVMGLSGARNVTSVNSIEAAREYLSEYSEDLELVLQKKLDHSEWTEMTVDLIVSDSTIEIANTRKILFSNGLWVGNYLNANLELDKSQKEELIKVGEYARKLGYSCPEGLNCGIDFFINGSDILITEINARYTGGLFPAEMLKRIGMDKSTEGAVAFFDMVSVLNLEEYLNFVDRHLFGNSKHDFSIAPMGFSPYVIDIDGESKVNVWQVVVGDFEEFKEVKKHELKPSEMQACEMIFLE